MICDDLKQVLQEMKTVIQDDKPIEAEKLYRKAKLLQALKGSK